MKFLIYDTKLKKVVKESDKYPNIDISNPLKGAKDIEIYFVVDEKPVYDANKQRLLKLDYKLTTELYEGYKHIKIAKVNYKIVEVSQEEILSKLSNALYEHLDMMYPLVERQKNSDELQFANITDAKRTEILNKKDWEQRCRQEKRDRESAYINENIFPSFEFETLNI